MATATAASCEPSGEGAPGAYIRVACPEDAAGILDVYRPYVEGTAVTFECAAPSVGEMEARISRTLQRYPYLVAVKDGRVVGFTYAGPLRARAAYDWSVETTIYVASTERGTGLGRALYDALEDALRPMGVLTLYACVAFADGPDEFLTEASMRFHERQGFAKVGELRECGSKFGRWYSIAWMQKRIGTPQPDPQPIRPFVP